MRRNVLLFNIILLIISIFVFLVFLIVFKILFLFIFLGPLTLGIWSQRKEIYSNRDPPKKSKIGIKKCPICGKTLQIDNPVYCYHCGAYLRDKS